MPLLDVTEILTDADFADTFHVTRRAETIGANGRMATTNTVTRDVVGVVTIGDPNEQDRGEDYQVTGRNIQIVSKFPLRMATTGNQPDLIDWNGEQYVVKHLAPYSRFGAGFYEAECEAITRTDVAQPNSTSVNLDFSKPLSGVYIPVIGGL